LSVAAFAAYLARVSRVYSFKRPASVLSFAFRHPEKAPPGHVTDRLGETVVLHHPAYVQILDRDRVKSSDQVGRDLVMEIFSTARYFQMRLGDFDSLFCAPLRPFPPARNRRAAGKTVLFGPIPYISIPVGARKRTRKYALGRKVK
jgi:3',5'-cyclic AMP phosphodiesterase CpdA